MLMHLQSMFSITALLSTTLFAAATAQETRTYPGVGRDRPVGLRLEPKPGVSINEDAGCEFNRVNGMVAQSNGNLVVANSGNLELCLFTARGRLLERVGRSGAGPGEYRSIESIHLMPGDSLLVRDGLLRRLSVLSGNGTFVRSIALKPPVDTLGFASLVAPLRDGSILIGYSEVRTFKPQPEAVFFTIQLFRYDGNGTMFERLGRFLSREHFVQEVPATMGRVAYWDRAFGRQLSLVPFGTGFIAGDGSAFDVRQYSAKGAITTIHKIDLPLRRVTPEDVAAYKEATLARTNAGNFAVHQKLVTEMPFPTHYPAFRRLLADPAERIWLEVYPAQGSEVGDWLVLDTARRRTSVVKTPARFRALAATGSALCGVSRDELDLESIHCYPVR
jgi:hypothetical protein